MSDDLHEEADQLAADVEERINRTEETLTDLPDFEPREEQSRALQRAVAKDQ